MSKHYGTKKELEFASCGRDLKSSAEMMNAFHHERLIEHYIYSKLE